MELAAISKAYSLDLEWSTGVAILLRASANTAGAWWWFGFEWQGQFGGCVYWIARSKDVDRWAEVLATRTAGASDMVSFRKVFGGVMARSISAGERTCYAKRGADVSIIESNGRIMSIGSDAP